MSFLDFVKQGLGITNAQKALQFVGEKQPQIQQAPIRIVSNLLPSTQTYFAQKMQPIIKPVTNFIQKKAIPQVNSWANQTIQEARTQKKYGLDPMASISTPSRSVMTMLQPSINKFQSIVDSRPSIKWGVGNPIKPEGFDPMKVASKVQFGAIKTMTDMLTGGSYSPEEQQFLIKSKSNQPLTPQDIAVGKRLDEQRRLMVGLSTSGIQSLDKLTPEIARQVLKVKLNATPKEISTAYRNLISKNSPRSLADLETRYKTNAAKLINKSRDVLLNAIEPKIPLQLSGEIAPKKSVSIMLEKKPSGVGEEIGLKTEIAGYVDKLSKEKFYGDEIAMDRAYLAKGELPTKTMTYSTQRTLKDLGFALKEDPSLITELDKLPPDIKPLVLEHMRTSWGISTPISEVKPIQKSVATKISKKEPKELVPEQEWEDEYADRVLELEDKTAKVQQALKTAKKAESIPLKKELEMLNKESARLEQEYLDRFGVPEEAKPEIREPIIVVKEKTPIVKPKGNLDIKPSAVEGEIPKIEQKPVISETKSFPIEPEKGVKIYAFIKDGIVKLESIEITPSKRKQGLGTKYVKEIEKWGKENGATELEIGAHKKSIGFWEKQGFKFNKEFPEIGGIKQDYKYSTKSLTNEEPIKIPAIPLKPKGNLTESLSSVKAILERSKKTLEPKVYPEEKQGIPYKPSETYKPGLKETQTLDILHKDISLQTKNFDPEKAGPALEFFMKKLGNTEMAPLHQKFFVHPSEKNVTMFWDYLREKVGAKGMREFNNSLTEVVPYEQTPVIPKKSVKTMLEKPKVQEVVKSPETPPEVITRPQEPIVKNTVTERIRKNFKADEPTDRQWEKLQKVTGNDLEFLDDKLSNGIKESGTMALDLGFTPREIDMALTGNVSIIDIADQKGILLSREGGGFWTLADQDSIDRSSLTSNGPPSENQPPIKPKKKYLEPVELEKEAKTVEEHLKQWASKTQMAMEKGTSQAWKFKDISEKMKNEVYMAREGTIKNPTPEVKAIADQLGAHMDMMYKYGKSHGIDMPYKKDFMTHIWNQESIGRMVKDGVMGRSLSGEPYFKKNQEITFAEGLSRGYKPEFPTIAQDVELYDQKMLKAITNNRLIEELKKEDLAFDYQPGNQYKPISITGYKNKLQDSNVIYMSQKAADMMQKVFNPKKVTGLLSQLINKEKPEGTAVERIFATGAELQKGATQIILSGGFRGINAMGFAKTFLKEVRSGNFKATKRFIQSMSDKGQKEIYTDIINYVTHLQSWGINIHAGKNKIVDVISNKNITRTFAQKVIKGFKDFMESPTFDYMLPAQEIDFARSIEAQARKKGLPEEEVKQIVIAAMKKWYDIGNPLEFMLQNRNFQNFLDMVFFAKSLRKSTIMTNLVGTVKALRNPNKLENQGNIKGLIGIVIAVAAAQAVNKASTDRYTWENPDGWNYVYIRYGTTKDGKAKYFRGNMTSVEFTYLKQMASLIHGVATGQGKEVAQTTKQTLGFGIKTLVDLMTNTDWKMDKIWEPTDSMTEKLKKMGQNTLSQNLHPVAKAGMTFFSNPDDEQRWEKLIGDAGEFPGTFKTEKQYKTATYYQTERDITDKLTPEDKRIYDAIKIDFTDPKQKNLDTVSDAYALLNYPNVRNAVREIAIQTAQKNNQPLDPLWNLTDAQLVKYYQIQGLTNNSDEQKLMKEREANWWEPLKTARGAFFDELYASGTAQKTDNTRPYPTPSSELQKKLDTYYSFAKGTGERTRYANANPDLKEYWNKVADYYNKVRSDFGLEPTPPFGSTGYAGSSNYGPNSTYEQNRWKFLKSNNKAKITSSINKMLKKKKLTAPSMKSALKNIKAPKARKTLRAMLVKPPVYKAVKKKV